MFRDLNNQRARLFVVLILLVAFFLRVYKLDSVPPGFWFDEASFGYSAYSVLETGRDEFGVLLPIAFKSFGQYNAPLYFYWLIPFIKVFGLNIFGVRLSSAVLGVLTTVAIYLLGKRLFSQKKIGIIAAFLFAISPFALQFNRMAHENNLLVLLITVASYFVLKGLTSKRYFMLGGVLFSLAFYTYLSARIFLPLFGMLFILVWKKCLKLQKKNVVQAALVMFVLLLPLFKFIVTPEAWPRVKQTSITGDIGIILNINEERNEHNSTSSYGRLFHNKVTGFGRVFLNNYLMHFSPDFLVFKGDPNKLYNTPNMGIIYVWELGLLLVGAHVVLNRKDKKPGVFLLIWLLIAFLPAALTRFVPSSSRSFQAAPAIVLITAVGLDTVLKKINQLRFKSLIIIAGAMIICLNFIYYLDNYYIHFPIRYAYAWRKGAKEVVAKVSQIEHKYEKIVVDQEGISYVNFLFFLQYPPEQVQIEAKLTVPDEFGFSYIPKIGKYYFVKEFPKEIEDNFLYIGRRGWIGDKGKVIERVNATSIENEYLFIEK